MDLGVVSSSSSSFSLASWLSPKGGMKEGVVAGDAKAPPSASASVKKREREKKSGWDLRTKKVVYYFVEKWKILVVFDVVFFFTLFFRYRPLEGGALEIVPIEP